VAKEKKPSSSANKKVTFSKKNEKRTSIGKSKNSRPNDRNAVRAKKGRP